MCLLGKPYAGKPHVRFDEGVERIRPEIEDLPITAYPFTLLYWLILFLATKTQKRKESLRETLTRVRSGDYISREEVEKEVKNW